MPKILMTQDLDGTRTVRTVVDGQQRIRSILEFHKNDYAISSAHNKEFARKKFSSLPEDIKKEFLQYELSCDMLYDMEYTELLDVFTRINTYTLKLNKQELLNAKYLGYFKQTAFGLGRTYVQYFLDAGLISKSKVARMGEAELASVLLVATLDKIQTNKNVETYYRRYEDEPGKLDEAERNFEKIMSIIAEIYPPKSIKDTNWKRVHLFYSLFCSIKVALFGGPAFEADQLVSINKASIGKWRIALNDISSKYDRYTESPASLEEAPPEFKKFIDVSRRATTDTGSRIFRSQFIHDYLRKF